MPPGFEHGLRFYIQSSCTAQRTGNSCANEQRASIECVSQMAPLEMGIVVDSISDAASRDRLSEVYFLDMCRILLDKSVCS